MLGSALIDEIIVSQIERELRAEDRNILRLLQSEDRRQQHARASTKQQERRPAVRIGPAQKSWSW